jgi:hypothetical protein
MAILTANLRHRSVDFQVPSDPLADNAWILLLQRIYADRTDSVGSIRRFRVKGLRFGTLFLTRAHRHLRAVARPGKLVRSLSSTERSGTVTRLTTVVGKGGPYQATSYDETRNPV